MNSVKLQDTKLISRNLLHSYTNNERLETEIKETIPFVIATKRTKYLGKTYLKSQKISMQKTIKILMKEIKDDTDKDIPSSWTGRTIFWKRLYYPKQSTDSMQSLSNHNGIFHRTGTKNFTIFMETQKTPNSKIILRKKWSWRDQAPYTTKLQSSSQWYWHKKRERSVEQARKLSHKATHLWSLNL